MKQRKSPPIILPIVTKKIYYVKYPHVIFHCQRLITNQPLPPILAMRGVHIHCNKSEYTPKYHVINLPISDSATVTTPNPRQTRMLHKTPSNKLPPNGQTLFHQTSISGQILCPNRACCKATTWHLDFDKIPHQPITPPTSLIWYHFVD